MHECDRRQTDRQTTLRRNVSKQMESLALQEVIPPKNQPTMIKPLYEFCYHMVDYDINCIREQTPEKYGGIKYGEN